MARERKDYRISEDQPARPLGDPFARLDASLFPPASEAPPGDPIGGPIAPAPSAGRPALPPGGALVLRMEKSGRGGKRVIVISGIPPGWGARAIEELARDLRRAAGAGGAVKGGEIVVQGDDAGRLAGWLRGRGYRVKGLGA